MNATARKPNRAERLAASADSDVGFDLDYCHQVRPQCERYPYEFRMARVVMIRHSPDKMLGETEDDFSIHEAGTGRFLGAGYTKNDAAFEARMLLMTESQLEFERAQQ